ncbi:MAG: TolC family protein [bacterium]|jgi:outer membrane protein
MNNYLSLRTLFLPLLIVGNAYFTTGCATVKHARNIQKGEGALPGERLLQPAEVGLSSNTTLTMVRALEIPLTYHPQIFQAEQSLAAATARVYQARAAYWPKISTGIGETRSTANTTGQPGSSSRHNSFNGSVGLDLLVYDFGKTPAVVRQAYANLISATENLRATRSDIAFLTRSAFLNLGKALELEQVAIEAVRQNQVHLDQVQAFIEVGRRTRYDLTKSEVDLGNSKLTRIKAHNEVVTARGSLNRSLGLATDPGYKILPDLSGIFTTCPADQLMGRARQFHPRLKVLQAKERVTSAAVDEAIAALYPDIGLQAKYGLSGSSFPLVWNWSAALQGSLQLFTGRQQTWRINEVVTQLRSARAQTVEFEQLLYEELQTALSQLDSSRQLLSLTDLIAKQAAESLELISERYRLGAASLVEVTDAQVALTSARAEQVKSKFDYQAAIAQLKHACGEE